MFEFTIDAKGMKFVAKFTENPIHSADTLLPIIMLSNSSKPLLQ